jgi:hypothetical protein
MMELSGYVLETLREDQQFARYCGGSWKILRKSWY